MDEESLYTKRRNANELAFFTVMSMPEMWIEFSKWRRCDVLILGLPNSGKSSVVDLIAGENVAKRERENFHHYSICVGHKRIRLVNACSDMKQWYKYFRENSTESYNLVLYVMRMGRISGNLEVVHFIRAVFGHIPIVLVITYCEDYDAATWNRGTFRCLKRSLGIREMECVTSIEDPVGSYSGYIYGDVYQQNINQKR